MSKASLPRQVAAEWMSSANDPDQVEHDLPVRPNAWSGWRIAIEPLFFFTQYSSVTSEFYDHYHAHSFDEAVGKLFDARRDDHVGYRCYAVGVIPVFGCTVEWPLLRRGKQSGITHYEPRPRIDPSAKEDATLFEVWRRPNGALGLTFTYMLSVNGRSRRDAVGSWEILAGYLRAARRQVARHGPRPAAERLAVRQP
jgi:hypothetical protein